LSRTLPRFSTPTQSITVCWLGRGRRVSLPSPSRPF
jgi:hypothetical protein